MVLKQLLKQMKSLRTMLEHKRDWNGTKITRFRRDELDEKSRFYKDQDGETYYIPHWYYVSNSYDIISIRYKGEDDPKYLWYYEYK